MRADFTLDGTASRKAVGFLKRLIPDRSPQHAAGDMTEEKRLTAAELFAKYDEDGSNSIDADELDLMLKECGHKPDKETAKLLLSEHVDGMEEGARRAARAAPERGPLRARVARARRSGAREARRAET